ncbi:single-stranded DNA-binding protein [Candidatus Dojkabacteria bacterium]|uniref:Single-stranded DNA-binding protein n=1 Tax=Candidatus Dojkabacteria bacterium TaxID=2099670 RepID=A0A955RLQ8_9BACT|nr:single-stranded DNA-binding protein [Candidatus Dojkabacteria bacterium]
MFGDINRATLMGNVTRDPELRYTTSGSAVLSFSIATNRRYKSGDDWKDEVAYHNIVVWRSAENLAKRLKKGTRIYVEGRMQTRSWDGDDGKKNYKTEVVADSVILIDRFEGKGESMSNSDTASGTGNTSSANDDDTLIEPDDLPF